LRANAPSPERDKLHLGQTPAEGVIFGHTVEGSLLGTVLVRPHPPRLGEFRMRKFLLVAALAALTPAAANAATWVAVCTDGKNVQYNQTIGGTGFLYLKTDKGIYQTARLSQTFFNGTAVCGTVFGNAPAGAEPITQVCANKSRNIIYLKYQNPTKPGSSIQDAGTFCAAKVTVQ
jgi:hypothetical protein